MSTFKQLEKELEAVSVIKTITMTYQEISQKEMDDIREVAISNRKLIEELSRIYAISKKAYEKEEGGEKKDKLFRDFSKGSLVIFLSANSRFYGSLLWDVWHETTGYLEKKEADLAVVGEMGKYFAENSRKVSQFEFFNIDDEEPKEDEVKELVDFVKPYKNIIVFHGKFHNIMRQESVKSDISGEMPKEEYGEESEYLFEPSTKEVLRFFEEELITAFFNQAFLEHRLSRHATRVVAMYQAGENAKERIEKLSKGIKRIKRKELDKKQFEITGSFGLWK